MNSFSQRQGIKPARRMIQADNIDDALHIGLWNALSIFYWGEAVNTPKQYQEQDTLIKRVWFSYFNKPIDTMGHPSQALQDIRRYFFGCKWNEVYDFVEFVANNHPDEQLNSKFMEFCNQVVLGRELSAYRFVGGKITSITSEVEINEVDEALEATVSLKSVNTHLQTAIKLFADRKSPDYRNSVKESVSAIEAICGLIAGDPKATLGQALKEIESKGKIKLHPSLKGAFEKLYGYTSDADGIRHALLDEPDLDSEDAKFILVSCSAFINYLVVKASKSGIKLS